MRAEDLRQIFLCLMKQKLNFIKYSICIHIFALLIALLSTKVNKLFNFIKPNFYVCITLGDGLSCKF